MELSDLIKQYVSPLVENKNNWYATRCMVCNDHHPGSSTFKGLRGNFRLDSNNIVYNCYNCDHKAVYNSEESKSFSKNMLKVLDSFGIPESEYNKFLLETFGNTTDIQSTEVKNKLKVEPGSLVKPDHFYLLKNAKANDKWAIIAEHYLKDRCIDSKLYDFYLSDGSGKYGKKWKGRIIFPIYKDAKLVFYQGRALVDSMIKKYENPSVDKQAVLYNYDEIFTYSKKPLFVVEGFFDAFLINGCALIGKNITKEQAYWLNRTNRYKVIIPDKEGDGKRIGLQALKLGWSISTPNFGSCKDINAAYIKYGKLYVINEIMSNIHSGSTGKIMLDLYCKK